LVATSNDGNARIGAERRVGVGLRESNALRRKAIQGRSGVIGLTTARKVGVAAIVNNNK
jgi:hypothetical protein